MLTEEQYMDIIRRRALPMIKDCLATPEQFGKDPDIVRRSGFTVPTSRKYYYFSKEKVMEHIEDLKDIYADLPRQPRAFHAPFGYVAYSDLITGSSDPRRCLLEFQLADCFTLISEISDLSFAFTLENKDGTPNGANSILAIPFPTRSQINARKKKSASPSSED